VNGGEPLQMVAIARELLFAVPSGSQPFAVVRYDSPPFATIRYSSPMINNLKNINHRRTVANHCERLRKLANGYLPLVF
jgi:hypothetical protein